ncbi:hypothetical protein L9F63_007512, partial [Diploptera punctata]
MGDRLVYSDDYNITVKIRIKDNCPDEICSREPLEVVIKLRDINDNSPVFTDRDFKTITVSSSVQSWQLMLCRTEETLLLPSVGGPMNLWIRFIGQPTEGRSISSVRHNINLYEERTNLFKQVLYRVNTFRLTRFLPMCADLF